MAKSQETIDKLEQYAWKYIQECINHTRPHVAGNGKVIQVPDRHIPTIDYFLRIWIPMQEGMELIHRRTWYDWLNSDGPKSHTIKRISDEFDSLARDIVGNEGKGIFYAKNKLGMHDRQHVENKNVERFDFED
jgi:hypothetical protein